MLALGERFGGRLTALGVHNTDFSARCSGWCTDAVLMRLLMSAPKLACLEITGFTLRATSAALIEFVASRASGPLSLPPVQSTHPSRFPRVLARPRLRGAHTRACSVRLRA